MTVEQLVDLLRKCPPGAEVVINTAAGKRVAHNVDTISVYASYNAYKEVARAGTGRTAVTAVIIK